MNLFQGMIDHMTEPTRKRKFETTNSSVSISTSTDEQGHLPIITKRKDPSCLKPSATSNVQPIFLIHKTTSTNDEHVIMRLESDSILQELFVFYLNN